MQPHVAMISVFSSGPLKQVMINSVLKFLEIVCNPIFPPYLSNHFFVIAVEMDKSPTELHYRGDNQGTLAIVADR